jgi:hypothetical protein
MGPEEITVLLELEQRILAETKQLEAELARLSDPDREEQILERLAILKTELNECRPIERYEIRNARVVRDKWKGKKSMSEEALEAKINEVVEALQQQILPTLKEAIAARDDAEAALQKAVELEGRYRQEVGALEGQNSTLKAEVTGMLSSGKDPARLLTQIRMNGDRIEALKGWIESQDGTPLLRKTLDEAEKKLELCVYNAVLSKVMPLFQSKANAVFREFLDNLSAWDKGIDAFCQPLGLAVNRIPSLRTDEMSLRMRQAPQD